MNKHAQRFRTLPSRAPEGGCHAGYQGDPVYRTLEWVRDDTLRTSGFRESLCEELNLPADRVVISISNVQYRPFKVAHLVARVSHLISQPGGAPRDLAFLMRISAGSGGIEEDFTHSAGPACGGGAWSPAFRLADRNLCGWKLSDNPYLPELGELLLPGTLQSLLTRAGLSATSDPGKIINLDNSCPSRRADFTWSDARDRQQYRMTVTDSHAAAAASLNHRQISAWEEHGALEFSVPRYRRYSPELNTLITGELPGVPFVHLIAGCGPLQFEEIGMALASLHSLPTAPGEDWSPAAELAKLERDMSEIALALPGLKGRINALIRYLYPPPTICGAGRAPIHGALTLDDIIYDRCRPRGLRVGLREWGAWCTGDPHKDLGTLIAHQLAIGLAMQHDVPMTHFCIEAFLDAYDDANGMQHNNDALRWQIVVALLRRASGSALRQLHFGWPLLVDRLVTQAEVYCSTPAPQSDGPRTESFDKFPPVFRS